MPSETAHNSECLPHFKAACSHILAQQSSQSQIHVRNNILVELDSLSVFGLGQNSRRMRFYLIEIPRRKIYFGKNNHYIFFRNIFILGNLDCAMGAEPSPTVDLLCSRQQAVKDIAVDRQ